MVPCYICGRNAESGWIQGFPPAPDSQKLGLCHEHNNKANREKVTLAWRDYLQASIDTQTRNAIYKAQSSPRLLSLFFVGGGSISVPCVNFSTPDNDLLKVESPDGEFVFFPLRQVRHYSLSPMHSGDFSTGATPPDADAPQAEQPALRPTASPVQQPPQATGQRSLPPTPIRALPAGKAGGALQHDQPAIAQTSPKHKA